MSPAPGRARGGLTVLYQVGSEVAPPSQLNSSGALAIDVDQSAVYARDATLGIAVT